MYTKSQLYVGMLVVALICGVTNSIYNHYYRPVNVYITKEATERQCWRVQINTKGE